jgi:hypothetical protein
MTGTADRMIHRCREADMNSKTNQNALPNLLAGIIAVMLLVPTVASSQVPVDENGVALEGLVADLGADDKLSTQDLSLDPQELEEIAGPIALYPDDLLAIILPASTYPLEIVQAARFLAQLETDSSLKPAESWDESVTALLNYPEVIRLLNEDIDWTWRLGEAVIAQQEDLIAAIESFRDRAYAAGNLKSDEHQTVSNDDGVIEIVPVDEEIIYVPYYEPEEVVVYQPRSVYYYYPEPYPVYYYPYPVGHRFTSDYFWGVTTAFTIGWHNRYLHVYHPTYWGHPYYGRTYYSSYYRRPSINVYNTWYVNNGVHHSRDNHRDGDYWRPRNRSGARPHEQRVRNRHYAPQAGSQSANSARSAGERGGQTQMRSRNNGRLELGLRERNRTVNDVAATRNSIIANQSSASAGANGARATRAATARQDRGSQDRSGVSNADRSSANYSANGRRSAASNASPIQLRKRRTGNTVRTEGTSAAQPATRSTQGRRTTPPNNVATTVNRQRTTVQQQRPASRASRSTPQVRQQVARTPAVSRPSSSAPRNSAPRNSTPRNSTPRNSTPSRSAQSAANRSAAGAVRERKEAPSRSSRRERKSNR